MYTLVRTPTFARAAERFVRQHPEPRMKLAAVLYSYRIIPTIESTEQTIMLLDIGSHDEAYR